MAPEHGQLDVADALGRRRAGLGELPGDAAHLHDRDARAVGEHDRHLQDDLQLVPDRVGREVVEGLGAVAGLEQEGLAGGDLAQGPGEPARLAGEHERRQLGELGEDVLVGVRIGPGRLAGQLDASARRPDARLCSGVRLGRRRGRRRRRAFAHRVRCGAHPTSVRGRRRSDPVATAEQRLLRCPAGRCDARYASRVGGPRRLGILGGTFDPVHVGHLVAAVNARHELGLDLVLLVVANEPWQKVASRPVTPAADRLALVEAAVEGVEGLEASGIEIERGGPSYTADTVAELEASWPGAELNLIVGRRRRGRARQLGAPRGGPFQGRPRRGEPAGYHHRRRGHRRAPSRAGTSAWSRCRRSRYRAPTCAIGSPTGRPLDFLIPMPAIRVIRERGLYPVAR